MRQCLKCLKDLPNIIRIDEKKHNICNRKFCLDCSPFKQHNTKNLIAEPKLKVNYDEIKHKVCSKCSEEKPIEEFYRGKSGFTYCKKCNNNNTIKRQRELKKQAVEYLGGKCKNCGYDKYIGAMDFHHIDPNIKSFTIGQSKLTNFNKIKSELDKCILLCSNCHREFHGGLIKLPLN